MKGAHSTTPRINGRHAARLSDMEKLRRAELRVDRLTERVEFGRHDGVEAAGSAPGDAWLRGLSKEARLQGIWALQHYQFAPEDRQRFRHYLRAHALRERTRQRHMAESARVEAWLWQVSQRLPWQRR
jgi:hypothetical protein